MDKECKKGICSYPDIKCSVFVLHDKSHQSIDEIIIFTEDDVLTLSDEPKA